MQRFSWRDLAPDLLRDISSRLPDAGDFFRFHAICKPWRDSHSPDATSSFPPWLLAAPQKDSIALKFRCVFSKSSYRATPPPRIVQPKIWVSCADPTTVRYLTVEHLCPSLHDPLTGEDTLLPLFVDGQWEEENPRARGAICDHGSILLYNYCISYVDGGLVRTKFRAALLRPGDIEWRVVERTLDRPGRGGEFCAVYHGGRILVAVQASLWHVIKLDGGDDVFVPRPMLRESVSYSEQYSYVLESRSELLWAHVQFLIYYSRQTLRVSVYALEVEDSVPEKTRWVRKDGLSLSDRVLFLGWPNNFAMDASVLGGRGGYAYFVHHKSKASPCEQYGVLRYDLVYSKVHFIERLSQGWDDDKCIWLVPQPGMASTQEITKKSLEACDLKQLQQINAAQVTGLTSAIHIERLDDPCFRVLVRNLPLTVTSSELQLFFSIHGKVFSAEVINYKKTKRSQGIGFVTIATVHAHPDDALDALKDLVLEGCKLEVSFVNEGRRGRRRSFLTKTAPVRPAPSFWQCR